MNRSTLPALLLAAGLALAGCGGPSGADARACSALDELADDAVDGQPGAISALAAEFDDVDADLSDDLEAQAVRVGGSALLEQMGRRDADLPQFIGQMATECENVGWKP